MTVELTAIRGNQTLNLFERPYHLVGHTGTGIPPLDRQEERGPFQNGVTDLGYRLNPRFINLVLLLEGETLADADTIRRNLVRFVRPLGSVPVRLRFKMDNGQFRQIDTFLSTELDFPNTADDRHGRFQRRVVLQMFAPDPLFYDPALQNLVFDVTTGSSGFTVPMSVPLQVAASSSINAVQSVTYQGDEDEYPVLFVTGPATNLVITNESIGTKLDFTGVSIADGDTYRIDLRYGVKTVTDSTGDNKIADLTSDSDLSTWRLAADPMAIGGINNIRVQVATAVTAATRVRVEFYNRYLAVA